MLDVKSCVVCQRLNFYPICAKCKKNPFKIEKCRQVLAINGDLSTLKKFYKEKLPEIKDLNTSTFWNKKLHVNESISQQDGMTRDRIKTVVGFLPSKNIKLLDIGAGHGFLEEKLPKNVDIFANDFSEESVKHLKKRFKGNFEVQSLYGLSYKQNYFDAICILEVLEHVSPNKVLNVLKRINQLMKPIGTLIVSVPMNEGLETMKQNPNGHIRMYTPELITAELELAGFTVSEMKTLYAFKNSYFLKMLIAKVIRNKWQPNNIILKAVKK